MNELGLKISQIRKRKGISQESLSEDAKINLRTLQRIEKGDTNPHGDTMIRLSEALEIPLEDLVSYGLVDNYGYIKTVHFVTLIFVVLPLGNILLPMVLWLPKKDKIRDLAYFSKKLLNFQITWSIITYVPFLYIMLITIFRIDLPIPSLGRISQVALAGLFPLFMYVLNFVYVLIAGILISDKKKNYFPIAIQFIK